MSQQWIDATTGQFLGGVATFTAAATTTFTPPSNGGSVGLVVVPSNVQNPAITVITPGTQTVGLSFPAQAQLTHYAQVPSLQWSLDNFTTVTAVPSADVTLTLAQFPITIATAGSYTLYVRDANNTSTKGQSTAFTVGAVTVGPLLSVGYGGTFMDAEEGVFPTPAEYQAATGSKFLPKVGGIFALDNRTGGLGSSLPFNNSYAGTGITAANQFSYIDGAIVTCGFTNTGVTPAAIVAGTFDANWRGYVDNWFNQGFTRQAGYTGWIYTRINWEFNYWGNTPGSYDSEHANGGGWSATTVAGTGYWFNTGSNTSIGGSPALATSNNGNFWAWAHIYNIISFFAQGSYAASKGVPIKVVWNPTAQNNYASSINIPANQEIYNTPSYIYCGDQYCDVHGIDIYSNHFYGLAGDGGTNCTTFPGYASAAPFTRNWPPGPQVPYATWALSNDNLWHAYDFLDATAFQPDGMLAAPATDPNMTGGSQWGWGMAKAAMFASATGIFAGVLDPVSGLPRQTKPFIIPECGGYIDGGQYGATPMSNLSGAPPAFMVNPRIGGCEDLGYYPWMASRIAYMRNTLGIDVQAIIIWNDDPEQSTARMLSTFGPAFPNN